MSTIHYTKSHEWIRVDGDTATVGITAHAAEALGDVVYVEVPAAGKALSKGKEAAVVESVKAASEVYAPVSGTVTEGNPALADDPALVNKDAMGDGWFFKLTVSDQSELADLLDQAAYDALVAESH
ncbi:MAG TPA: glycine cleavage system protein GcvH [Aliidongia sp.]|uniref:glycine cleavage system protein GcvH n=1 Tax=Aliidongia sp. TaxID=1914230 RepID=UPI002DDDB06C|nr:glycine cleavage system protein GcvH [Aliidongia sp.]HEV2673174.1 glycine cleavage system protein GcvH [Aliidongia sp.]